MPALELRSATLWADEFQALLLLSRMHLWLCEGIDPRRTCSKGTVITGRTQMAASRRLRRTSIE